MTAKCGDVWGHHCVTGHRQVGGSGLVLTPQIPWTPARQDLTRSLLISLVSPEQSLSLLFEKDSLRAVSHGTYLSAESLWRTWAASYISKQGMQCYFFLQCAKISPMTKDQKVDYKHKRTKISYRKQLIRWT